MGKTAPPILAPVVKRPNAIPRRFLNQWDTIAKVGPNIVPQLNFKACRSIVIPHQKRRKLPTPTAKPWQRRNCQYCAHSAIRKVDATSRQLAKNSGILKYPRSNIRPVIRPGKKMRAYWKYCKLVLHRGDNDEKNMWCVLVPSQSMLWLWQWTLVWMRKRSNLLTFLRVIGLSAMSSHNMLGKHPKHSHIQT